MLVFTAIIPALIGQPGKVTVKEQFLSHPGEMGFGEVPFEKVPGLSPCFWCSTFLPDLQC